ncbi:MAG: DUF4349 domain-containing protein [Anaerolineales bacterium]|nr:DUF4349 domain-containing protein [Anaerolineales bacterium]
MSKRTVLVILIIAALLSACGVRAASAPSPEIYSQPGGVVQESAAPMEMPSADVSKTAVSGVASAANATTSDRLVIMNADLTIVVKDPQTKMDAISQMAESMGGFVVSMNMYQTYMQTGETAPQGSISIRVPADKLDAAISQIKADAVEVQNETRTGEDVTAQYTDLKSQLTNLELAEKELQAIMEEAKNNPNSNTTSKTQDVLAVYNQIVSVRGQIEQIKGQMQYYEQSSSYSLINVTLIAEETIKPIEIGGWKPQGVARDAIQALVRFLQGFVNFVIWFVLLVLPVIIVIFGPIALVVWGIVAAVRKHKAKKVKKAAQPSKQ